MICQRYRNDVLAEADRCRRQLNYATRTIPLSIPSSYSNGVR
jgi:hypothetical protein